MPQQRDRAAGQASTAQRSRRRLHHHQPDVRRSFQLARQPEEALPQHGHDASGSRAHRSGHALLTRLPYRRDARVQDRAFLQPLSRAAQPSAALRLWSASAQGCAGQRWLTQARAHAAGRRRRRRNAGTAVSVDVSEQEILIQSVSETIVPKLIAEDVRCSRVCSRTSSWRRVQAGQPRRAARSHRCGVRGATSRRGRSLDRKGAAAVPDSKDLARSHARRPIGHGKDAGVAGALGGIGAARGARGRLVRHRPQSGLEGEPLRHARSHYTRVERRSLHSGAAQIIDNVRGESTKRH